MRRCEDKLGKAAIALALLAFLTTLAISYRSAGMAEGLQVAETELDELRTASGYNKIQFSGDGEGTYVTFTRYYGWLAWLFATVAALLILGQYGTSLTPLWLLLALLGVALATSLYFLRTIILDKSYVSESFWEAPRNRFAHETIAIDWILVVSVLAIFSFQIPRIVSLVRRPGHKDVI